MVDIVRLRLQGIGVLSKAEIEVEVSRRLEHRSTNSDSLDFCAVGRDALPQETQVGDYKVARLWDLRKHRETDPKQIELQETVESLVESHPAVLTYFVPEERLALFNKGFQKALKAETGAYPKRNQTNAELFKQRAESRFVDSAEQRQAFETGWRWYLEARSNEFSHAG